VSLAISAAVATTAVGTTVIATATAATISAAVTTATVASAVVVTTAAVTTSTAVATATTAAIAATARASTLLAWLCLVHTEVTATKVLAVQRSDRFTCCVIFHLHETEATGPSSFTIDQEVAVQHLPKLREEFRHFVRGCGEGKVPYINPLTHPSNTSSRSDAPARTLPAM